MKRYIAWFLTLAMSLCGVNVFAKTEYTASDWAKTELEDAENVGIIPTEFDGRNFTQDINRMDFAKVLVKTYEVISQKSVQEEQISPFEDCTDADILKAYTLGFINGVDENHFSPKSFLTREQAATMLMRTYKKASDENWSIENDTPLEFEKGEDFADDADISDWAKESVYFMSAKELVKGVGENRFAPKNHISVEQAVIAALRLEQFMKKSETYNPDPYTDVDRGGTPEKNVGEDVYTAAFIGGSLTAGGSLWISETKKVLEEHMPGKTVRTINAGKGGTTSQYGAARFMEDVGQYAPDIVFVEFAVNDTEFSTENQAKMYMESIVRQCKKLTKEPIVVCLYAPYPVEKDSDLYKKWAQGVAWKEEVARHYGIKSINIYDYMQNDYAKTKEENGYNEFTDYLKKLYQASGSGFNVHGGYPKYAEAIREAFTQNYDECMSPMKNAGVYCKAEKDIADAEYKQISVDSPRMNYAGNWNFYTAAEQFTTDDGKISINSGHYLYPYFTHGIAQLENDKGAFGFDTTAAAVSISYSAATAGSSATVYIDQKESGTVSCQSIYHGVNYNTNWISLPNDGKTHRVIFVVDRPSNDNYVFRFGSIIERYTK